MHGSGASYTSLHDVVRPRRFLSYSRRDGSFIERHLKHTRWLDHATWWDVEQIATGERWGATIEDAIRDCDELILLMSEHSLASAEVAREITLARNFDKHIVPIIIAPMRDAFRNPCADVQHLDLSDLEPAEIDRQLARLDGALRGQGGSATSTKQVKVWAARGVWPPFSQPSTRSSGSQHFSQTLSDAAGRCGHRSPLVLNHGLLECTYGRLDAGIAQLERYAYAANNLAGWYFLALHLPRGRPLRTMRVADVHKMRSAIDQARALGCNPLVELLNALCEVGCENRALHRLDGALSNFERGPGCDAASEYLRFFHATHLSWSSHRHLETHARNVFRRLAQP